jgi:hypothetical protein
MEGNRNGGVLNKDTSRSIATIVSLPAGPL